MGLLELSSLNPQPSHQYLEKGLLQSLSLSNHYTLRLNSSQNLISDFSPFLSTYYIDLCTLQILLKNLTPDKEKFFMLYLVSSKFLAYKFFNLKLIIIRHLTLKI